MPASRWYVVYAALIATLMVAACSSPEEALIARGYSPDYAQGYEHGCTSGKADVGGLFAEAQKDEARYAASGSDYAKGWDAGFAKCRSDERQMVIDARNRHPSRDK